MDENSDSVPRSRVFVLLDGTFVVKWSEHRVQNLLTGLYRNFERRDFGAPITDFELNQLKQSGVIERYDREHVWLSPSPERSRYYQMNAQQQRIRSYYLNTTLDGTRIPEIESCLMRLGVDDELDTRVRDDFVVIWGTHGRGFSNFDAAEEVRQFLISQLPDIFSSTVVAFIETTRRD
ncbi:MAG TPA: hypothetical protein VHL11_17265 [Phototrophicaceae bacterium]|jgi:hypothetical protein|nr:hypothetical protein [Phototrophicaceae bacterium]